MLLHAQDMQIADVDLYNCNTQRGICRIMVIMYNMRQKDISSVYM